MDEDRVRRVASDGWPRDELCTKMRSNNFESQQKKDSREMIEE